MNQKIHLAPFFLDGRKAGIHGGIVGDVGREHEGLLSEAFDQWPDALFQRFALIGKSQLRALRSKLLGNAPGNRILVGDTHDEAALALHQIAGRENSIRHGKTFQDQTLATTTVPFVPPKPKELDMAVLIWASRVSVMMGRFSAAMSGSMSKTLIEGATKLSRIINSV